MIKGLYRRLALVLLSMFIILGAILFWLYETSNEALQQETSQKLHLHLAEYLVQDIALFNAEKLDHNSVKEAFSKIMMIDPATELYVIDPNGNVLAYDAPEEKIKYRTISLAPIDKFLDNLKNKEALPIFGDDPRSKKQKIFSVAPVYTEDRVLLAYLYIIINGEAYDTVATAIRVNKTLWMGLGMIGAALIFLLLTTLLLFNKLTRPLIKLSREVVNFEQSDFQELPKNANSFLARPQKNLDEFQQLRGSFYRMSQHICNQLEFLKKHDELRSEFLAHVSHDLRTPLAGVQAYLETLQLNNTDISEEERKDFLHKAFVTNNRLSTMIDELFELSRLEYGEIDIHPEKILLSDLLSDMYATLNTLALEKDIELTVNIERGVSTVHADVARLDRVFQNLITNAIQYTPEKGAVTVNVIQADNNQVKISVSDTGQGIAEADLPFIYEPFFRSKSGRRVYQEGKGLGLAITEKLLALHGSKLAVASDLKTGTTFSFVLEAQ